MKKENLGILPFLYFSGKLPSTAALVSNDESELVGEIEDRPFLWDVKNA